jgi:hypothetical protein
MPDSLEVLGAKQDITEVLYRYCQAVDRIDPELGSQIWHADGQAHYEGIFEGTGREFMEFVLDAHRATDATSHQLANPLIEVDGERATSESYVTACIRAGGTDIIVRGRYTDRWSRRSGAWRIDDRRFTQDILQVLPVGGGLPGASDPPA